jgi:general secretion pathway protein K
LKLFRFPNNRGFSLPVVLGVSLIIMIITTEMTASIRSRISQARGFNERTHAFLKAKSAFSETMYNFSTGRLTASALEKEEKDGTLSRWNLYGEPIDVLPGASVTLRDTAGMIPVLYDNNALRKLLFTHADDNETAAQFADALFDWQDEDRLKRLNGAEEWEYRSIGKEYIPRNHYIQLLDEITLVLGFDQNLFEKIKGSLIYFGAPHRNYLTMDKQTLTALLMSSEMVDQLLELRSNNTLTAGDFHRITGIPSSMSVVSFPSNRIVVNVTATHGEAMYSFSAVVEKKQTETGPFKILEWRE